ncbi:transposase [Pseudoduganella plicata]|uniref:DNA-binding protein n=1 Tax=Pseudoduganella plicata TaxID=321984 RepID=A0AA87YB14_9BURK|nr:transposase [Pseudoduganella plicata]GGY86044.1 DNA-binding protein [Pseudoduganella plicata]
MESEVEHGRRRRSPNYPLEFKRKLAQLACEPGLSVAQLALQHDLNTNMVFKWRRQSRAGLFDQPGLVAVTLAPTIPPQLGVSDQRWDGVIEIRLTKATMRIQGRPDPATLAAVLKGLRG